MIPGRGDFHPVRPERYEYPLVALSRLTGP
ncbi:hypothetical protein EDD94_3807 [Streptomyces sp. PanSC9]|nr:hypothetical protein EDD94_3807 [Streptomyces sp. PanSC9]